MIVQTHLIMNVQTHIIIKVQMYLIMILKIQLRSENSLSKSSAIDKEKEWETGDY